MIVVNVLIESSAADIDSVKEAIAVMEVASQAEEGCEDYTFSVELNNPNNLRITEKWSSAEALVAHFKTSHMATFQAAMVSLNATSRELNFYEATPIDMPS